MLIDVNFKWSDEHGRCQDCGRPAAYKVLGMYQRADRPGSENTFEKMCAVCAAYNVWESGNSYRLEYLFDPN